MGLLEHLECIRIEVTGRSAEHLAPSPLSQIRSLERLWEARPPIFISKRCMPGCQGSVGGAIEKTGFSVFPVPSDGMAAMAVFFAWI